MKHYAIVFILLLSVSNIYAQNCKYLTNKVSGMDGSRLVITQPSLLTGKFYEGQLEVWATLQGDTAVTLAFVISNKMNLAVSKGDSVFLTLQNDDIISIPVTQDAKGLGEDIRKLTIMTTVGNDELAKLELHPVKHISIPLNVGNVEGFLVIKSKLPLSRKRFSV
jgi:thiazole synthase ThiGH ThiG subunit